MSVEKISTEAPKTFSLVPLNLRMLSCDTNMSAQEIIHMLFSRPFYSFGLCRPKFRDWHIIVLCLCVSRHLYYDVLFRRRALVGS